MNRLPYCSFLPLACAAAAVVSVSVSVGCGDPQLCDPVELAQALEAASPGDEVHIGNCRVEGNFSVPAGVRLSGLGRANSSIAGAAGSPVLRLNSGGEVSELASFTVESEGPIAILGRDLSGATIVEVDVRAALGVGIGFERVMQATITDTQVLGTVDAANAAALPLPSTATISTTYGLVLKDGGDAQLQNVQVTGFSEFGATLLGGLISWTGGGAPSNRQVGLFVGSGSVVLQDVDLSHTFKGFRPEPSFGGIFAGPNTSVDSNQLSSNDGDGLGLLHVDSTARHLDVDVSNNQEDGVRIESMGRFELSGTVNNNAIAGISVLASTDVSIHDAAIDHTRTGIAIVDGEAHEIGDGIHLIGGTSGIHIEDSTFTDNERVGILVELMGQTFAPDTLANLTVTGSGDALGAIVQGGTPPAGWDQTVMRNGDVSANDATFSDLLDTLSVTGPCDFASPDLLLSAGLAGIAGS